MTTRSVIVVGAGAAGLMAAGSAVRAGGEVILLEKTNRPARKLTITGKGRCNLTNVAPLTEFIGHFGDNGKFLRQALTHFFSHDLVSFLGELGLETITERGGRVFPASERAEDVTETLMQWVRAEGVRIKTGRGVGKLVVEENRIRGVTDTTGAFLPADAVIVATGGASYPATGSTGDGYRMAHEVGHSVVPIRPALVPVNTEGDIAARLQGLSLRNVTARIIIDGRKKAEAFGEMLFTHFGLSGPIILTLSRVMVDALRSGLPVAVSLDLKPALNEEKLDARLLRDFSTHGSRQFHTLLKDLLPSKLIPVCLDLIGITPDQTASQITASERRQLRQWLKDFRLNVISHRSFDEAIITAGGVSLKEVDPRTMQSRLVRDLYFAGEVLDIDGDTGGYNLQAAFSTGWLAGQSAGAG